MNNLIEYLSQPASPQLAIYGMMSVAVFFLTFIALYSWWEKKNKQKKSD